jgi:hypothetical protein
VVEEFLAMEINRTGLGVVAFIGLAAFGGGACLGSRDSNRASQEPPAAVASVPVANAVTETENIIATPAAESAAAVTNMPAAAPAPAAKPAPVARRETAQPRRPAAPAPARAPQQRTAEPAIAETAPTAAPSAPSTERTVAASAEPAAQPIAERVPPVQEAPRRTFEDITVPADTVIGLQVENAVSSDSAKVEQQVRARVTRDVQVQNQVAIPAGARAEGSITLVERGGRLKDQARLGIRFHTIVLADGTRLPINTETIYREGESPVRESAVKIGGGAVGGAMLGAIIGGKKGAIIGSTVGAAGGGAAVAASQPNPATLPAGSTVTVRMDSPAAVTVER